MHDTEGGEGGFDAHAVSSSGVLFIFASYSENGDLTQRLHVSQDGSTINQIPFVVKIIFLEVSRALNQ